MQTLKSILALAPLFLLCANDVPPSSDEQLAARSDLVIEGRVALVGVVPPKATPDRVELGEIGIGSLASQTCVQMAIERRLKGLVADAVVVCGNRVAELNLKPQQLGRRYIMFLRRAGAVYVAVSWDAVKELPSG